MNELANLNQIVSEIKFFENQATESFWEIGKRLSMAREQIEHGEWMNWVSSNLGYSYDTTNNLIKVYKEFPNFDAHQNLGFQKMLSLTSIKDEEERQDFIEKHEVEEMTTRQLQAEIKEYKEDLKRQEELVKEKDEEIGKLKTSNNSLYGELQAEKSKDPQVIEKEVVPDDYDELKAQLKDLNNIQRELEEELYQEKRKAKEVIKEVEPTDYKLIKEQNKKLEEKLQKEINKNLSLISDRKLAISQLESEKANKKIVDDISSFHYSIAGFIRANGGLLYLTDYIDEVPAQNKKLFLDSIRYLREFSEQLYKNVEDKIKEI